MHQILYRQSDGEILAWGPMPGLVPDPGNAVLEIVEQPIPARIDHKKIVSGAVVEKTGQEKQQANDKVRPTTPGKFLQKFNQQPDAQKLAWLARKVSKLFALREPDLDD